MVQQGLRPRRPERRRPSYPRGRHPPAVHRLGLLQRPGGRHPGQAAHRDADLHDAKRIPADEPVVLAGDLTIDSHGSDYQALLTDGNLAPASARPGRPYSFDTADNSIAAYRYPGDPKEDLDHVLHRADHARPQQYAHQVVRVHSAPWTVSSWGKSYTYTDLSDHYPLAAH
ncbi:endonuclease/exonuclease/phosphatase family protein [Kitasatospora sp. NPDC086791]|uniref:endonuclease/exonuclease/phosphatase family protein n=1 Tax=Kitasatospora sp. NPDC086791 TaxID=3155178 RepID=UPI00344A685E